MPIRKTFIGFLILFAAGRVCALEPEQILVIANSDYRPSLQIAQYYCAKRSVPTENILALPLGAGPGETISRNDYKKLLAEPILKKLYSRKFAGQIRCLLTTYGIPIKVTGRGVLKGQQEKLAKLKKLAKQEKGKLEQLELSNSAESAEQKKTAKLNLKQLQAAIDRVIGKETGACVDSELSMVLFGDYELYRWQPNKLRYKMPYWDFKSLMVCRLDGPSVQIAQGLIDKAITAERDGLRGAAYIDWGYSKKRNKPVFAKYDKLLRDTASMIETRTTLKVTVEDTQEVFRAGGCPQTAVYCGWYSLKKYVDAFDFVDGAIGYHISSLEAVDLRDQNSSQWCPAMLADGVTATMGAVAEPYLRSFPNPAAFFTELVDGRCLVEAYYRTKPFNSWQMVLIGDPLYKPFTKP